METNLFLKNIVKFTVVFLVLIPLSGFSSRALIKKSEVSKSRLALVIGNSKYKVSPLKNPVNDANDVARVLKGLGFSVIHKINADQKTMEKAIRSFGNDLRKKGGIGLFYYAGHGIQVNGRNYLIPVDANIESESDVKYESVDAGRVLGKMEDAGNDINVIILDACRNNPYAKSFRSSNKGLARMDAPKGSIVSYSTAPGSVAADGNGRNGVYTKHLINFIQQPGFTIEQVMKKVRVAVLTDTNDKQTPWESTSLTGNFFFAGKPEGYKEPIISQVPEKVEKAENNEDSFANLLAQVKSKKDAKLNKFNKLIADILKYKKIIVTNIDEKTKILLWDVFKKKYTEWSKKITNGDVLGLIENASVENKSFINIAKEKGVYKEEFSNSIDKLFVYIKSGTFFIGKTELERWVDDIPGSRYEGRVRWSHQFIHHSPSHRVQITKDFYFQKTEVTQGQWLAVMGKKPDSFKGENYPVVVSWEEAKVFIKRLNTWESDYKYRLPTEAEWEYACRAGSTTDYFFGNDPIILSNYAWYKNNTDSIQEVAKKLPNDWGLYDMYGNVAEWCEDGYDSDTYKIRTKVKNIFYGEHHPQFIYVNTYKDPLLISSILYVHRGGSYLRDIDSNELKSYGRDRKDNHIGFRLVCVKK